MVCKRKYYQNIALYYGDVAMPKDWDIDRDKLSYYRDILKSQIQFNDYFPFSRTWDMLQYLYARSFWS